MVEESLRAIFDAEKKSKEQAEAAQREASAVLESTRKEAAKIKESAKLETKTKVQRIFDDSRKKAEAEVQELMKSTEKQILIMERKAKARHPEAVKLVLDAVVG